MSHAHSTAYTQERGYGSRFPWSFFALIAALSVPLWALDGIVHVELMPGLPISALMILSTAASAAIFAYRRGGTSEFVALLRRSVDFRRIPASRWYAPIFLLMPAILLTTYFVMRMADLPLPHPDIAWSALPLLILLFGFAAVCEELAWSATALDPLQARWGAVRAALVIGIAWSLWHAVPLVQAGNPAPWIFGQLLFLVVFRGVIVWLYNHAGASVFAAIGCHASYNVAWQLFPNRGSGYDPWVALAVTALALVVLVIGTGFSQNT